MYRFICWFTLSASLFLISGTVMAQGTSSNATATCNFDSSKQLAIEYQRASVNVKKKILGGEIPYGRVWTPGGKPMTLFTNVPVAVGGRDLPLGAYTLFVIPENKGWTLIVSKSTDTSGKYDEQDDIARVPMETGQLIDPEPEFSVYFAHVAPDQCSMRLDLDRARAWTTITEK